MRVDAANLSRPVESTKLKGFIHCVLNLLSRLYLCSLSELVLRHFVEAIVRRRQHTWSFDLTY